MSQMVAKLQDYSNVLDFYMEICFDEYRKNNDVTWQVEFNEKNESYSNIGAGLELIAGFIVINYMRLRKLDEYRHFKLTTINCWGNTTFILSLSFEDEDEDEEEEEEETAEKKVVSDVWFECTSKCGDGDVHSTICPLCGETFCLDYVEFDEERGEDICIKCAD